MATENRFFKFIKENPRESRILNIYLWIVIIFSILKLFIFYPYLFSGEKNKEPKRILATIAIDAAIVKKENEKYLVGYLIECHESDISNERKTPDVNAVLGFGEKLRYTYTITNNTSNHMLYEIGIIKDYEEKNLFLSYKIGDNEETKIDKNNMLGQVLPNSRLVIHLYVKINDNLLDADLSGKFTLNVTYFADEKI